MDLICYSHLRWNFVYQRPQHLLTRFAKKDRVFYIEEPVFIEQFNGSYQISSVTETLFVVVPHLQNHLSEEEKFSSQQKILTELFRDYEINDYLFWYYTPMALPISSHLSPQYIIYDCMDELSTFKFAPAALKELEIELFDRADIVFTGGHNLYNAKKNFHNNIHAFPSSIDKEHFARGHGKVTEPEDQALISHPRFGFYGVVDERFDIDLLVEVAKRKPGWQFIILGPVVKIDPDTLPKLLNIHYLGSKTYDELPDYLSSWDIALIPFVLNDSTKYISPTKTPEYLAAGKPVISTAITDIINPYGIMGLVHIINDADEFIQAAEGELSIYDKSKWLADVNVLLSNNSWDNTWLQMVSIIKNTVQKKTKKFLTHKKRGNICLST